MIAFLPSFLLSAIAFFPSVIVFLPFFLAFSFTSCTLPVLSFRCPSPPPPSPPYLPPTFGLFGLSCLPSFLPLPFTSFTFGLFGYRSVFLVRSFSLSFGLFVIPIVFPFHYRSVFLVCLSLPSTSCHFLHFCPALTFLHFISLPAFPSRRFFRVMSFTSFFFSRHFLLVVFFTSFISPRFPPSSISLISLTSFPSLPRFASFHLR
jgi:hypothetical protein